MKKNYIGRNSLIIAILGLVIIQVLIYVGYLKNENWHILSYAFEAATIGGFADWFAVRALFHEIPVPFIKNHTNIIVKNRAKLSNGIVDLVTNKWLSPDIIKEKISNIKIVKPLIGILNETGNKTKVLNFFKEGILYFTNKIDQPGALNKVQVLVKEELKSINFAMPIGQWIKKSIREGNQNQILNFSLDTASKALKHDATRNFLQKKIEEKIENYKKEAFLKEIIIKATKIIGVVDSKIIADKILDAIDELIIEIKNDEKHTVRKKIDTKILEFATNLVDGDANATKIITDLQYKLIAADGINRIIDDALRKIKENISSQVDDKTSFLNDLLEKNIAKILLELESNKGLQEKINVWIKNAINSLVKKHHHEIGDMVSMSLAKLKDKELVSQIEEKVGNDLQYIRLNGAIVGGFIGLIIALIRIKLL